MKHHKTAFILIGLIIFSVAVFFYIDNIFLPIQFKQFITTKARQYLNRQVSVDTIDFRPFQGFIIKNISIARKDDPQKPFIQIDEVAFNLLLAPIFQKKAVIIPNIKIKNPYLYLERGKNGIWNFSDLTELRPAVNKKNPFSLLMRKLSLVGGKIHYKDASLSEEFFESIEDIRLYSTLSLNKGVRFVFQAKVPRKESSLKIKGNYSLLPKKLTAQILTENIHLARYLSLLNTAGSYTKLDSGILSSAEFGLIYENKKMQANGSFLIDKMSLKIGENKQMNGIVYVPSSIISWQDNKWNAKGQLQLSSLQMSSADGKSFQGDIKADLNLITIFENRMTSQGDVTVDNARLIIDENNYFHGQITATNASLVKGDGKVRLQGNFDITRSDILVNKKFSLKGDLTTVGTDLLWSRDGSGADKFTVVSGFAMKGATAVFGEERSFKSDINVDHLHASVDKSETVIETTGQLESAEIHIGKTGSFQGSPYFNIFFRNAPKEKTPFDYKGTLRFTKGSFNGIPYIDSISDLKGIIGIMPEHAQTDSLTFTTQDTAVQLSGLMTDSYKPKLNVNASSENVDLKNVLAVFPGIRNNLKTDITGNAQVQANYSGPLLSPSDAEIYAYAQLNDVNVISDKLPKDISGISGKLNYRNDLLEWIDLQAHYGEKPYVLNGQLKNLSRPSVNTEIIGENLKCDAYIKLLHSAFQLLSLTGKYLGTSFDIKGDVHFSENAPADIDMRGKITLDLGDLGVLAPRISDRVKQLDPVGLLTIDGIYKGTLKDWRNWQLAFDALSDQLKIKGHSFHDVDIRYTQRDRTISKCNVTSKLYNGDLSVISSVDLRHDEVPFIASVDLKNSDLSQVKEDKDLKKRQLAGILVLSTKLSGDAAQWRKMTGEGSFSIANGHLWQWNILDGLSKALLIPEFKNFVFTDASGDFAIGNQRIFTDNTKIISQSVTLDAKGWMDFNRKLNFDIKPTFSELAILKSESVKKGPTAIITQTDGYLNIKLTGSLDKPLFNVQKSPLKIIEGTIGDTTETIKDVIGGVLGEIF